MQWLETEGDQFGIHQAYLFGSVIRPYHFTERSDVDIAVESVEVEAFFTEMASLSEAIERNVDLVELPKCPFAHRIRQRGQLWKRQNSTI